MSDSSIRPTVATLPSISGTVAEKSAITVPLPQTAVRDTPPARQPAARPPLCAVWVRAANNAPTPLLATAMSAAHSASTPIPPENPPPLHRAKHMGRNLWLQNTLGQR